MSCPNLTWRAGNVWYFFSKLKAIPEFWQWRQILVLLGLNMDNELRFTYQYLFLSKKKKKRISGIQLCQCKALQRPLAMWERLTTSVDYSVRIDKKFIALSQWRLKDWENCIADFILSSMLEFGFTIK